VAPLLDRQHLRHQTLGDGALERTVLGLFLDEAPRYAADIAAARDLTSWRMAVHTLKGVALNIGAFRLAQLCRVHEHPSFAVDAVRDGAAAELLTMIETTAAAIRTTLVQGDAT